MIRALWFAILGWLVFASAAVAQSPANPKFPGLGPAGTLASIAFEDSGATVLRGPNARAQLVITGAYSSGQRHDLTHEVKYQTSPSGIVEVEAGGYVRPLANGAVTITAAEPGGKSATLSLTVEQLDKPQPINFANEIVPILTRLGCNAGGCHGKSDGQNGFKLSLLGFYPSEDYDFIVKENRGRRIFPAAPEYSLLLLKPTNQLPHGGGHRLDADSFECQLITRWIEQGTPFGSPEDPVVKSIEVFPKERSLNRDEKQQLAVIAHYSDGSRRDVTRLASYESNDIQMALSTTNGLVTASHTPGDVAVMIRFQGQVSVFVASIPLGLSVTNLPPAKNFVDEHVFAKLKSLGIPPSPVCDDGTFLRRVCLDIAGRLPTAEEARAFIASADPAKRDKLIDQLLDSPGYGDHFGNKWSAVLRNRRRAETDRPFTFRFHHWIRQAVQENMPYDQFVRSILAASGDVESFPPVAWYKEVATAPEQMEDTAQLFLGLRIACAKCHHHPFEKWSQDDYYGFQAFFSQVGRKPNREGLVNARVVHLGGVAAAQNPRSGQSKKPAGLGAAPLDLAPHEDPRHHLVDWMAAADNPFFAKALVNRYWKHFFGRGIVDPEDDMRATNPPTNPALLDAELAKRFVESKFDIKDLIRTICRSSAYQLSSEPTEYNQGDKLNFSSFYPRRLNAEPLYDAINQVAGTNVPFAGMPVGTRALQLPDNGFNDYFLQVFGKPESASACECERSAEANLAQSLHLLNSTDIQGKLSDAGGQAAKLAKDARADAQKVEDLYYAAFARAPRKDELALVLPFIEKKSNKQEAYEDLLWAIFNTKEFLFNR